MGQGGNYILLIVHIQMWGIELSLKGVKPTSFVRGDLSPSDVLVYVYYQLQQMDHLVRDVDNGGGYVGVKAEYTQNFCTFLSILLWT